VDTDFGDTLQSLAQFGASIGGTIASTYRTVNAPVIAIPNQTLPSAAPQISPYAKQSSTIIQVVIVAVLAVAAVFGIRALSK
jgi:putative N-acetylmannosamine-6-phosphate epimerase